MPAPDLLLLGSGGRLLSEEALDLELGAPSLGASLLETLHLHWIPIGDRRFIDLPSLEAALLRWNRPNLTLEEVLAIGKHYAEVTRGAIRARIRAWVTPPEPIPGQKSSKSPKKGGRRLREAL